MPWNEYDPYSESNALNPINQSEHPVLDFLVKAMRMTGHRDPSWGLGFLQNELANKREQDLSGAGRIGAETAPSMQDLMSGANPYSGIPETIKPAPNRLQALFGSTPAERAPSGAERQAMEFGRSKRLEHMMGLMRTLNEMGSLEQRTQLLKQHQDDVKQYHDYLIKHGSEMEKLKSREIGVEESYKQSALEERAAEANERSKTERARTKVGKLGMIRGMMAEKNARYKLEVEPFDRQLKVLESVIAKADKTDERIPEWLAAHKRLIEQRAAITKKYGMLAPASIGEGLMPNEPAPAGGIEEGDFGEE